MCTSLLQNGALRRMGQVYCGLVQVYWNGCYGRTRHYGDVIMSTMASQITSPRLFAQQLIQAQIKENIKAPRHWPLWGVTGEFAAQRTSNAENASIWWRHHGFARSCILPKVCQSVVDAAECLHVVYMITPSEEVGQVRWERYYPDPNTHQQTIPQRVDLLWNGGKYTP